MKRKLNEKSGDLYSSDGLYGTIDYGSPGVCKGLCMAHHILTSKKYKIPVPCEGYAKPRVLVVGAGNGYEIVYLAKQGYDVTGLEYYIPDIQMVKERSVKADAAQMPFKDKTFDMCFSAETMEHVQPEQTDNVLNEMGRVAGSIFLTIATRGDPPFNSHINIHDGLWWGEKIKELGFKLIVCHMPPLLTAYVKDKLIDVSWADGVYIVATR